LWGCRSIKNKQTIAIAVKYPIRSAAIVISSPPVWNDAAKTEEKLCPMSQQRLGEKWNYSRPTSGSPQHSNQQMGAPSRACLLRTCYALCVNKLLCAINTLACAKLVYPSRR
jgi:hypothetical protein